MAWRLNPDRVMDFYQGLLRCIERRGLEIPAEWQDVCGYGDFLTWCSSPELFEQYVLNFLFKRAEHLEEWMARQDVEFMFLHVADDLQKYRQHNEFTAKMYDAMDEFEKSRWLDWE